MAARKKGKRRKSGKRRKKGHAGGGAKAKISQAIKLLHTASKQC